MNSVTSTQRSYPNINTLWSEIIVEELARSGVRHAVISPGSRSTPLVFAFSRHPDITDHSVIDERSAAYFALGLAKATRQPVVLLCTSGTAAANYFPAVCEADRAQVPLLLFTADRPVHLRESGAPQTMDQVKLYGDRVRLFFESAQPEAEDSKLRALRANICHAVAMARSPLAGPVHLNIPFRKPLEPIDAQHAGDKVPEVSTLDESPGFHGRMDGRAWTRYLEGGAGTEMAAEALLRAQRPLIIAGPDSQGSEYAPQLLALAQHCGIPVFAEAASQLRFGTDGPLIATSDLLLRSERFREWFRPDCIVQLGAAPTNSQLQHFLDTTAVSEFLHVASDQRRQDPSHRVSQKLCGDVSAALLRIDAIVRRGKPSGVAEWTKTVTHADREMRGFLSRRLQGETARFEGSFIHALGDLMPEGSALIVSSSMPIRDVETFLPESGHHFDMYFNRGVNGIDGIVSTALGVTRGRGSRCVLLTGDIAFLHNLTAMLGDGLRNLPLTVILLNNDGGEIFEMLPARDFDPVFTKHFVTPHATDFPALVTALGLQHHAVEDLHGFTEAFQAAGEENGVHVLEIRTTIAESGGIRRSIMKDVADAVDALMKPMPTVAREHPVSSLAWRMLAEGEGDPVLLLHGFTRSAASWEPLVPLLAGHPLIAVDLMGHGLSPVPVDINAYRLEYAAARIEELLDRLGLQRIHLVGYSMGGRTAMACAASFTGRIASLALISAHPGIEDTAERDERRASDNVLADRIETHGLETFVREWSGGDMFGAQRAQDPGAWQRAVADRMQRATAGLARSLRGSGQGEQNPYWNVLRQCSFPTLIAAGTRDVRYTEILQRMCDLLPDSEQLRCADAGHDLLFERPQELADALLALWKRA